MARGAADPPLATGEAPFGARHFACEPCENRAATILALRLPPTAPAIGSRSARIKHDLRLSRLQAFLLIASSGMGDEQRDAETTLGAQRVVDRDRVLKLASSFDLLAFVNSLDRLVHKMPRDYEREAVTRLLALMTVPARIVSPRRPAELARSGVLLRNVRFEGPEFREIFFRDQPFTEVDAIFLGLGSVLGHVAKTASYIVEVERKSIEKNRDYYRAMQRARLVASIFARHFGSPFLPVVVFDDREGRLTYKRFDGDLVIIPMSLLADQTGGIRINEPDLIAGRASDRMMVKLDLLRILAASNPDDPRQGALTAAQVVVEARGRVPLHLPVYGHQRLGSAPRTVARWVAQNRERDDHLEGKRLPKYLNELCEIGALTRVGEGYRLTELGGDIVLIYSSYLEAGDVS